MLPDAVVRRVSHPARRVRRVSKLRTIFRCTECGADHPKWAGQCATCGAWNSLTEDVEVPVARPLPMSSQPPVPIDTLDAHGLHHRPTGVTELDRVLGGGLVSGSVTLLGGEPGIGKSTLMLQVLAAWPGSVLYVTAEESAHQVRLRAERLGATRADLWIVCDTVIANIVAALDEVRPSLVVVDSIQTVADHSIDATPGSVAQVRACAHRLVGEAKARGVPMVLVGHVTKDGTLAGPRQLEHLVDTVLAFEGDRHHALRIVRAVKHRYGATDELGVFEMAASGLVGIPDASGLFLADRRPGVPGSAVTPTMDGARPLLVEVQALTAPVPPGVTPRRSAQGIDSGRLALLLAVLERRARIDVSRVEVYASSVGGARLTEPGADLAVCLAIASTLRDHPLPDDVVVFGEVGLGGELRQVPHEARRLTEAARMGFARAIVPLHCAPDVAGIEVLRAGTLAEAIDLVGLGARGLSVVRGSAQTEAGAG